MKKIPWLSLSLLFSAYTTFGWFLLHATVTPLVWVLVFGFTLCQALLLTTWFDGLKRFISRWLQSDVGYFTLIIVFALGFTIAVVWFKIFGYFLVLISAEVLARLDLQNAGFNRLQALVILAVVSWAGLVAGSLATQNPLFRPVF